MIARLTLLVLLFVSLPGAAQGDTEVKNDIEEKIALYEREKRSILDSLFKMRQGQKKIAREKSRLTHQVSQADHELKDIALKVEELEQKLIEKREKTRLSVRRLHQVGRQGLLPLLFAREKSVNLDRQLLVLSRLFKRHSVGLREFKHTLAARSKEMSELTLQARTLAQYKKQVFQKESKVEQEERRRIQLVENLEQKRESLVTVLLKSRLPGTSEYTGALLNEQSRQRSFFEERGLLPLPFNAPLAQEFGLSRDKATKAYLAHKGWSFQRESASAVKSIYRGRVVFIDDIVGLGSTVIVDHGDEYYSVYSGLKKTNVQLNQTINAAAVLGFAAQIYFEIRHFSEALDPARWIQSREIKVSSYQDEGGRQ